MSTLKVNTLIEATSGGATFFTNKAWVNFNGTGTVAIRDDGNVSSITDNAVGKYTSNFSNSINTVSYAPTLQTTEYTLDANSSVHAEVRGSVTGGANGRSTSSLRFSTTNGFSFYDMAEIICVITT